MSTYRNGITACTYHLMRFGIIYAHIETVYIYSRGGGGTRGGPLVNQDRGITISKKGTPIQANKRKNKGTKQGPTQEASPRSLARTVYAVPLSPLALHKAPRLYGAMQSICGSYAPNSPKLFVKDPFSEQLARAETVRLFGPIVRVCALDLDYHGAVVLRLFVAHSRKNHSSDFRLEITRLCPV